MLSVVFLLLVAGICEAKHEEFFGEDSLTDIWGRQTLTNRFFGLGDGLAENGIELGLSVTQIYQQNVRGGVSKHRRSGRFAGSYDIELSADLERLLGIEGGGLYMLTEGGWSEGIDASSVESMFGVNGDACGDRVIDVTELWYEQALFDHSLLIRIGKLDLTGGFECRGCPVTFDGSAFANDETGQFLNSALVNNPAIPFPDYGLGVIVYYNPIEWWYVSAGAADAQADIRETGFRTTFHDEDYFFYIFEAGVTPQISSANGPLQGAYRVGMWVDGQDKARFSNSKNYRDDTGLYISCDQRIYKENNEPKDRQGLGIFGRFGYANSDLNEIGNFWSLGFQYQGLIDGRDEDVLGLGFAQGVFSDQASLSYTDDYESVVELYYNARVAGWLNISPSVQYVANPGGVKGVSDAVVLGVRVQITF